MDPTEKLLFQDPFHEVKRKRDKKKEVPAIKDPVPLKPRNPTEQPAQGIKSNTYSDRNPQRAGFVRNGEGSARNSEGSARNSEGFARNREGSARNREFPGRDSDHFVRNREGFARNWEGFARNKEGFARNSAPDSRVSRQFHVVRDNRIKHNGNRETKPPAKSSVAVPANEPKILKASEQSPAEASKDLQSPSSLPVDSLFKEVKGVGITGSERNDRSGGKKATISNVRPPVQATKPHDSQQSSVTSPNSSVVGVCSSSSDPVHIPSLASRPAANVGAIKREVGAAGARRHTSEKFVKENSRSVPAVSKSDQLSHSNVSESAPIISTGRAVNNSRSHQPVTHQKDPFHEVKRKRDKKKEVPAIKDPVPLKPRNLTEQPAQGIKSNTYSDRNPQRAGFVRNGEGSARNSEGSVRNSEGFARNREGSARNREFPGRDSHHFVRNREGFARNWEGFARNKEGFARNSAPDSRVSRQFHVVRDNRIKHNGNRETKPPAKSSVAVPANEPKILKASEQSPAEASKDLQSPSSLPVDSLFKEVKGVGITGSERNDRSGGKKATISNVRPPVQATKPHDSQQSSVTSPNSSVVGVCSSSSDPVHIPSLASRPAANVGAIKHEVGAAGARRHTSEKSVKENSRSVPAVSKSDQLSHSNVSESAPNISTGRAVNNSRSHQPVTHQKASLANKEWKPKSGWKPNVTEVGVIGTPKKSKSSLAKNSKDKPSLATTHEHTKCEPLSRLSVKKIALKGGKAAAKDTDQPKRPATAFFVFMETFKKQFKDENPTIKSVGAVGKAGGAKWRSMSETEKAPFVAEAEQRKTGGISSVESVISNNDLLTEILLKLPLLSLILFKSVSKSWLSLIKQHTANLTLRRNLDPPSGLFLQKCSYEYDSDGPVSYDFFPFDVRIPICRSSLLTTNFTFGPEIHGDVRILHSCNGLLLCFTSSFELYVYNPSITNMFRLIPDPDSVRYNRRSSWARLVLAFDPTKSHHYKVVYAERVNNNEVYQVHIFSSETGNWSLCGPQFREYGFAYFANGVYVNDAIYWENGSMHNIFKLDIMNEPPVLKTFQTPLNLRATRYQTKLFESRGCLLVVGMDRSRSSLSRSSLSRSRHITVYENGNVDCEWSVKYVVNLNDILKPFPKRWNINVGLLCIVLEEKEEDSFMVMEVNKKVVQYKIASKTVDTISAFGPDDDHFECLEFIPSFANV